MTSAVTPAPSTGAHDHDSNRPPEAGKGGLQLVMTFLVPILAMVGAVAVITVIDKAWLVVPALALALVALAFVLYASIQLVSDE